MWTGRTVGWVITFFALVTLAIPWFLWGDNVVVAGLPRWIWWHVAWMVLATIVFATFTRDAWDDLMGVDPSILEETSPGEGGEEP